MSKYSRDRPLRMAVWSGPRNISTAMLRSWGNRSDTAIVDEPFYAHYLAETGLQHPGYAEVLAHQENDWEQVKKTLLGPVPDNQPIFYQKHMAHHLLPHMQGDWLHRLQHVFLIRRPAAMLLSLAQVLSQPALPDTGLPQQLDLFEQIKQHTGMTPLVVDSVDLLRQPEPMLRAWCAHMEVEFTAAMLNWPPGPRDTDGIWAKHWYASVEKSTGFMPYKARPAELPDTLLELQLACDPYYHTLYEQRLQV